MLYFRQVFSKFSFFPILCQHIGYRRVIMSELKPPEEVRGQTVLDKQAFKKEIEIPVYTLTQVTLSNVLIHLKPYFLKLENLKPVQNLNDNVEVYLNPFLVQDFSSFSSETQTALTSQNLTDANLIRKKFLVGYENFSVDIILRAVLPPDKEGMASFSKVGHIVHVNLREHLLPYKELIGEVLFDKVAGCRTVVNKIQNIDNTYRNFQMEVLKGDNDMLTTVKESNCSFKFDFSKVYWNSRLSTEHERIIKRLNQNDILFDVFAGVGPFSIPCAKKKCYVYANDLNPESFKWLNHNAQANKIKQEFFKSYNKDGKDFIKDIIKTNLPSHLEKNQNVYIVMNLPALAVEFLSCFVGLFEQNKLPPYTTSPTIFLYCFAKGEDCKNIAKQLVIDNFGINIEHSITDIFRVRTVSSMKEMMRVSIKLDRDILEANVKKRKLEETCQIENKKQIFDEQNGQKQKAE